MINYMYIFGTIFFTIYGQLILKWQVNLSGEFPTEVTEKVFFVLRLLLNTWIISAFAAAFFAAVCWMAAMTKFELSYAYLFMSLSFVSVLFLLLWELSSGVVDEAMFIL